MSDDIQFVVKQHIGYVTLNRPKALNALTLPMIIALQEQLDAWENDSGIHAVVVKAKEGRAFCAGGDVRWLYDAGKKHDPKQMTFFWHEYRLNHFISRFPKPYIALMNGVTMGGGVGISLHGSHAVATENFVFAMPETSIGFFPDIGASYLLARCPGEYGLYLGLTGARLSAFEAQKLGLLRFSVHADSLLDIENELLQMDLSQNAFMKVDACLERFSSPVTPTDVLNKEAFINKHFQQHNVESILSSLQNNNHEWCQQTYTSLMQKAPLSLKVTLQQIRKAKNMTFADCLKMDYCLVGHFMQEHDFYEGVRALLVDKDKNPQWQPKTLADITDAELAAQFECREEDIHWN